MFAYILMYSVLGWLIEIDPYNLLNKIKSDIDQDTFVEADETIKVIKNGTCPFFIYLKDIRYHTMQLTRKPWSGGLQSINNSA